MQRNILSGTISIPEQKTQRQLHRQLSEFANWIQRAKDTNEVLKDKQKSASFLKVEPHKNIYFFSLVAIYASFMA